MTFKMEVAKIRQSLEGSLEVLKEWNPGLFKRIDEVVPTKEKCEYRDCNYTHKIFEGESFQGIGMTYREIICLTGNHVKCPIYQLKKSQEKKER